MKKKYQSRTKYRRRAAVLTNSILLGFAALLALLVIGDSLLTTKSDLRAFDPIAVARLETKMWRSYYDRCAAALFVELIQLMRTQYNLSLVDSLVASVHATRAAFVFKGGHNRTEYERALPGLVRFYTRIGESSSTPFDVNLAAKNELEWWIKHREVTPAAPQLLCQALAELQATLYRVPVERVMDHARARAEAMLLRDQLGDHGQVSDAQWKKIQELLERSWASLHAVVNDRQG